MGRTAATHPGGAEARRNRISTLRRVESGMELPILLVDVLPSPTGGQGHTSAHCERTSLQEYHCAFVWRTGNSLLPGRVALQLPSCGCRGHRDQGTVAQRGEATARSELEWHAARRQRHLPVAQESPLSTTNPGMLTYSTAAPERGGMSAIEWPLELTPTPNTSWWGRLVRKPAPITE
jgi:hypothetical protein